VLQNGKVRKLTPTEYKRLQGIPEWYQTPLADSHIYNMCGDGWNIPTIMFIFRGLK
jgi:DNA (cytosine-5)-methyltransferase 3A